MTFRAEVGEDASHIALTCEANTEANFLIFRLPLMAACRVLLALGGNIGKPVQVLNTAVKRIASLPLTSVQATSFL